MLVTMFLVVYTGDFIYFKTIILVTDERIYVKMRGDRELRGHLHVSLCENLCFLLVHISFRSRLSTMHGFMSDHAEFLVLL